jgi:uroporphyrinogen-III synthase
VLLTREAGKNNMLMKKLQHKHVPFYELPLVQSVAGPDQSALAAVLRSEEFAWVVLTSPEASKIFIQEWLAAGQPHVNLAVVGKGVTEADMFY